jgi:ribosome assembly protein YihI (activator of Der GTPase)
VLSPPGRGRVLSSTSREVTVMVCDIARNLEDEQLERINTLEQDLGLTVVAFSCRSLEPEREERLHKAMDALGPLLQAEPAQANEAQLERIRRLEETMGLSLVAVEQ